LLGLASYSIFAHDRTMIEKAISLLIIALYCYTARIAGTWSGYAKAQLFFLVGLGFCGIWFAETLGEVGDYRRNRLYGNSERGLRCLSWFFLLSPVWVLLFVKLCRRLVSW